eukprot:jgi/Chrpa1/25896/Chrysochromulina_OHIO_Genome00011893-RA
MATWAWERQEADRLLNLFSNMSKVSAALPDQSILGGLVAAQAVTLADLSASGVALFFVATLVQPLVFAHVNGFEVLGAELPIAVARSTPMRLLEYVPSAVSSTFHTCCAFRFGSGRGVEHRNGVYDCVD